MLSIANHNQASNREHSSLRSAHAQSQNLPLWRSPLHLHSFARVVWVARLVGGIAGNSRLGASGADFDGRCEGHQGGLQSCGEVKISCVLGPVESTSAYTRSVSGGVAFVVKVLCAE